MKLTLSLVIAVILHGIAFGVIAVSESRGTARPSFTVQADIPVEVEVVTGPSSHAELPPAAMKVTAQKAPAPRLASGLPKAQPSPEIAAVDESPQSTEGPITEPATAPRVDASGPPLDHLAAPSTGTTAAQTRESVSPASSSGRDFASATPRYRVNPRPDYPIPSRRRGEEGVVLLNVVIQTNGVPESVSLNRSSGHPMLDRAAIDAVRRWSFEPARAASVPVASRVVVPVRFSLAE